MGKKRRKPAFSPEERWLFAHLSALLGESAGVVGERVAVQGDESDSRSVDWGKLLTLSQGHAVLPLLYPLLEQGADIPEPTAGCIRDESRRVVQQSYRLMFLTHFLVDRMEGRGITVAVLKGVAVAGYYPVPELRKSGDVDLLLLDEGQLAEAEQIMEEVGFQKGSEQHSQHHQVWKTPEGIELELHVMLAEPFDDRVVNAILEEQLSRMAGRLCRETVMGLEFPVLGDGDSAYYLLLHMLHHYLRAGFGLKLLCDWVAFWGHPRRGTDVRQYVRNISETGLVGFSDMITCLCETYFGLPGVRTEPIISNRFTARECRGFMRDILDAGEFGTQEEGRMVIARGGGPVGYLREFHHQMCLNYPEKSRWPVLWPTLWMMALYRFFQNNRTRRRGSVVQILRKAGERGRMARRLGLFQRER